RKAKELYEVFESGPMKKIAKYGGLPKPTGCV
ncbi:MAG: TusE/DsrC/DsvC family sulfur relay protein, partial [Flavobacteriales bacterium]|nr:TusE/DsrC/DsvC family sulfur relay protein [Flavobacteriales bacterium]